MTLWIERENQIRREFKNNKENFLRQQHISKTMHGQHSKLCRKLHEAIKDDDRLFLVEDPKVGDPKIWGARCSQSTLRSLYYYRMFEDIFDVESINHVTDFGAGYGNNCRVWHALGYDGEYFLIDLPVISEIQQYYTSQTIEDGNLHFMNDADGMIPGKSKSLFMATFSLNETTMEIRKTVEPKLEAYDYIFIHYNNTFEAYGKSKQAVDNREYFNGLKDQMPSHDWYDMDDDMQGKNILIGYRK